MTRVVDLQMARGWRTGQRLLLGGAVAWAAACNCLVNFDPEGQPCGSNAQCLPGYRCNTTDTPTGVCTAGEADSGTTKRPCGGACQSGETCLGGRDVCAKTSDCSFLTCPMGEKCDPVSLKCAPVLAREIGARCSFDSDCAVGGSFCLLSSAFEDSGAGGIVQRAGFCTKPCLPNCPTGTNCVQVRAANHDKSIGLCLAAETSTPSFDPLYHSPLPCERQSECADFSGFHCMVFDHPTAATLGDAVAFCDSPVATGVAAGAACSRRTPPLPVNGICLPDPAATGFVGNVCREANDCPSGYSCLESEYNTRGPTIRRIDACARGGPGGSFCRPCTADGECQADAPHCLAVSTDGGMNCRPRCDDVTAPCAVAADCQMAGAIRVCVTACP